MKILFCIPAVFFTLVAALACPASEYGVAQVAAPVLNVPHFAAVFGGKDGLTLKTDSCGQVRELEYIALPGTVFSILEKKRIADSVVFQVATAEYDVPSNVRLYVDSRFVRLEKGVPAQRIKSLPQRDRIVAALRSQAGISYVWGGNVPCGVPQLASWFFRGITDAPLAGVDCSGLLYHATNGWTPRNTSQLTGYGRGVVLAGKSVAEIVPLLQPLDVIVWNGHVIIVLDHENAIESRLECGRPGNGGVIITPLSQRLAEIMRSRRPLNAWLKGKKLNDGFVVRRWLPPA